MKKSITLTLILLITIGRGIVFPQADGRTVTFSSEDNNSRSKSIIGGQPHFIPDGPSCPEQCILDSILVYGFPAGLTLDTNTDLESICIRAEHSFVGDLGLIITCPNGQSVVLDPNTHSGGAFLGEPLGLASHQLFDGSDHCNPLDNLAGSGWLYCWSELYPTQGTLESLSSLSGSIPGTDVFNQIDYIEPSNPLSGLMGCPMNGYWKLRVCDDFGNDNGWLFGWEITYNWPPNILGKVYWDLNENGVMDTLEPTLEERLVTIDLPQEYGSTGTEGAYGFYRDTGNYTLAVHPPQNWKASGDSVYNVAITDPNYVYSGYNFGIIPKRVYTDVGITLTGTNTHVSHQEHYYLGYKNWGPNIANGTIQLTFDPLMTLLSSSIPPDLLTGNVIEWNYDSLLIFQSRSIDLLFQMPGWAYFNSHMSSSCWISPIVGDTNILNNYDTLNQIIIGPSDPNFKEGFPTGEGLEGFINLGQTLEYTIHFQNIGNDTAHTVMIIDSLDLNMEPESFALLASSHPMTWKFYGQGVIEFLFENIMLPDSSVNEPGSQGFVKFSLGPQPGLPDLTETANRAHIVFDYNPVIATNLVLNTYVDPSSAIADQTIVTDKYSLFPNPAREYVNLFLSQKVNDAVLCIYDLSGREVFQIEHLNGVALRIECSFLKPGAYVFSLIDGINSHLRGRLLIE